MRVSQRPAKAQAARSRPETRFGALADEPYHSTTWMPMYLGR